MAKMSKAAAPKPPMTDDDDDDTDAGGGAGGDAGADDDEGGDEGDDEGDDDEAGEEDVLLTVVKESDGTYSLIKGDEEDADGEDAAGSSEDEGSEEGEGKQNFDSVGELLKGILMILKEDQSSAGESGGSEDQFQSGFTGASPAPAPTAPGAAPLAQKY